MRKVFPEAMAADYREGHPRISRALERSTTFLSLVSLIALIVGALGVATAIHSHLQQRLDSIAILKCLGARSARDHAHLHPADHAARAGRRPGRRGGRGRRAGAVPASASQVFPVRQDRLEPVVRRGRNRRGDSGHAAVHHSAAAGDSQGQARPDLPARNGGAEAAVGRAPPESASVAVFRSRHSGRPGRSRRLAGRVGAHGRLLHRRPGCWRC